MSKEDEIQTSKETEEEMSLESKLTYDNLKQLRSKFLTSKHTSNALLFEQFASAINDVMQTTIYEEQIESLFAEISKTKGDKKCVAWNDFLDYLIRKMRTSNMKISTTYPSLHLNYTIKLLTHNRREPTSKILSIAASSFIYVFLSKLGVVGILDRKLKLQKTYVVDLDDLERDFSNRTRRICKAWATDAVHMEDCKKLLVGSTSRTLHFYDISAANHMEEFRVFGLPNTPTCFTYWCEEDSEDGGSTLLFGDDVGNIHRLHFKQAQTLLFKKPDMEGLTRVFFMDFDHHRHFVNYTILDRVHNETVVRMQYVPHNGCLISCSEDIEAPLVIRHIHGKLNSYLFKLPKGMQCFDFFRPLNLLVTGSRDCLVRLWNPYVVSQPLAVLSGHRVAVLDTRILSERNLVVSYSRDMTLKTWSLLEHNCLQTIFIKFPIARQSRADPEHGHFPLHSETFDQKSILVTCHDYVAELKLSDNTDEEPQVQIANWDQEAVASKNPDRQDGGLDSAEAPKTKTAEASASSTTPNGKARLMLSEAEALNEFGTYIFAKMHHSKEGQMSRKKMKQAVSQGMAFRSLRVDDLDDVSIATDLPMSERMRNRGLAYSSETDFRSLNLTFAPGSILDGRLSSRSSVASTVGPLPTVKRKEFQLPNLLQVSSNESHPSEIGSIKKQS